MTSTTLHPAAIIHKDARIGDGCTIGPYCVIGPKVKLGKNCVLHSHVVIEGNTTLGDENEVFPFASIGHKPQDLKFKGEDSRTVIGNKNIIREYVTIQPGTAADRMETTVGSHCLFMASSHVAHDCVIGNNVILANCATLAGHITVGDFAFIGGLAAVLQRVRIGHNVMIGGMSGVEADVIPYGMVVGQRGGLAGLNFVGLERRGYDKKDIHVLRNAYKALFDVEDGTFAERLQKLVNDNEKNELVNNVIKFIQDKPGATLCMPRKANG